MTRRIDTALTAVGQKSFRALFERSLDPMIVVDDERRCVDANPAMCLLLRLRRVDVRSRSLDDLVAPGDREALAERWRQFLAAGAETGRISLLAPDGARIDLGYRARANLQPGKHLWIMAFAPTPSVERAAGGRSHGGLTARELEVLAFVARGRTGQEIGERLSISPMTVQTHVRNSMAKLGARTRAHAIAIAMKRGELP